MIRCQIAVVILLRTLPTVLALTLSDSAAANAVLNGTFERGPSGWRTFNRDAPNATFSLSTESHSGAHSVRVETSAKTRHEGIRTEVKGLRTDHIHVVSAYAKGAGYVAIFAFDGQWTYGPRVKLTDQWQKLEIRKFVSATSMTVHIVADTNYYRGSTVFFVDDVRVARSRPKALADVEVPAIALEAEDFAVPSKHVQIVENAPASNGRYVRGDIRWVYLARRVPCPQTSRPVYLYARVWTSEHRSSNLAVRALDTTQTRLSLPKPKTWVWARCAEPIAAAGTGDVLDITVAGDATHVETRMDAFVLTTRRDLDLEDLAAALGAGALAERGLVRIARTGTPPVIDAALADPCWQSAVEVSPFVRRGQIKGGKAEFPKDETRAYLCYDESNLYVAFKCAQEILKPVNNQLGAFQKNTVERDQDTIWKDDCVLLLLDTDLDQRDFFNLMVNAAGTILDERCPADAPWRGRDTTWQSESGVKTMIGEGVWTLEASVSFRSLGVVPRLGDRWGLALGRVNMTEGGKGVQTSWQPMEGGFHNAEEFGLLEFGEHVPGTELLGLPDLAPGGNVLRVALRNAASRPVAIRLGSEVTGKDGGTRRRFEDQLVPAGAREGGQVTQTLADEGQVRFRYSLTDPRDLSCFYRSPRYLMRVRSSAITIEVRSRTACTVFLNGNTLGTGSGERNYTGPLYQGVNAIAVRTADQDVELNCRVGDERFTLDGTWRCATRERPGWCETDFDDRAWPRWHRESVDGPLLLRKNLLFRQSKIWPPNGGIHVPIGATVTFWHPLEGLPGRVLRDYRFSVELPEGIELAGATAFETYKHMRNRVTEIRRSSGTRRGRRYLRHEIHLERPIARPSKRRMTKPWVHCYLGVRALRDVGPDAHLFYSVQTDAFTEVVRSEPIVVYPRLNARRPRRHVFICRGGVERYGTSPALEEAVADAMSQCGFTHYSCRKEQARRFGMGNYRSGLEWSSGLMQLQRQPAFRRLDEDGKEYTPTGWCPSLLLRDEAREFVAASYARSQQTGPFDIADWDMENSPFAGRASCFCRECLARFREFAKLPRDFKLNRETVERTYREPWVAFQCRQVALTARVLASAIERHDPETIFSIYSAYQSSVNRGHYSIEWPRLAPHIDVACCGYGRRPDEITATLDALRPHRVPLLGGVLLDCPYESMEPPHPRQTRKVDVLRRVLDCRGGVFFMTPNRGMDARSYIAFAEVTRLVAEHEELFIARKHDRSLVAETSLGDDDIVVLRQGRRALILLLNDSDRERPATLRLASNVGPITDYYRNGHVRVRRERVVEARIPATDFVALVCE